MTRHLLSKPLLSVVTALAVISVSGAGYAVTSETAPAETVTAETAETFALDTAQRRAVDQQAEATAAGRAFRAAAVERAAAERTAQLAAEKEAARQAELEAERGAEAERQVAAERASRAASRDPRSTARAMLGDYGWGGGQFDCLDALWQRESGWKHTADNPTSSAYGIPQALPGSKMASAGADWRTNPATQIRWGLGYIRDVYGSPCAALQHSDAKNWY